MNRDGQRHRRMGPAGFSLVELLVAAGLAAAATAGVLSALAAGVRVLERAAAYREAVADAAVTLEIMERDIRSTFDLPGVPFVGKPDRLELAGAWRRRTAGGGTEETAGRIVYHLETSREGATVSRETTALPAAAGGATGTDSVTLLTGAAGMRLAYCRAGSGERREFAWRDTWGGTEAGTEWELAGSGEKAEPLPVGVRIVLRIPGKGGELELIRTVYLPARL